MYTNVSAEFLTALQRPSRHFAARFKDNGTVVDLEVKHIKAHFGSCGASSLAVGCAFSSYIEVTANRTDILLEGKELFLEIGLLLTDDSYEYVPFGYWTVQKPTKTKDSMSFQAVDRMNGKFNAEYETELTYPATVAAVLSEFTTKTGITVHCSLQTSPVMIAAPIVGTQRNALSIIAATLLGNAWIDRNGEIQIATIGGGTVVEVNYDYVKTQPEMDEEPTVIEGVKVYTVEGQTDTWIERGTGNQVTVSDVYMTDANLDIVKNNVIGLTYGGGTVSFMGNPLLDPSDIIKFRGGIEMEEYMLVTETNANLVSSNWDELAALAYESYEVPCMDIVQDFDGGLLTTVTATGQFEDTESTIAPAPMASELARQASAINSAQQTADNAVVLANGKNKIFYQDDAPTAGMSVGDMWFDTNGGNAIYEYKSTGWVLRQLGQGSLAANSVTAVEINVATLSAITANIGTVTAGVLRSSDYQAPTGSSVYSTAGMIIDLNNKVIRTPKTAILSDGSIYSSSVDLTGKITATSGTIGPWTIGTNAIYNTLTSMTDASHDGTYLGTDGIKMVAGSQTVWNALVANSTWSYIESANEVVGIRMIAWPDGSSGLYEYDVPGGNLSTLWLRSGTTLSTDFHLWVGSDVDSYVNILKSGTIALSAPTGGKIEFCYDGEIPATASIYESARGRLTLTGHATLDLPLTGGTLTGNVTIGQTTDTYVRTIAVRNSLGNVSLAVGGDGLHGIWSDTKGGWLLYANSSASSTDNNLYIPRRIWCSAGRIYANIASGEAQVNVSNGTHTIYLYCNSNGTSGIYAFNADGTGYSVISTANGATTSTFNGHATSDLPLTGGTLTGALTVTGTLTGYDYSGSSHVMVGSASDASHRVGYLYHQNATTVRVYGQAGGGSYTTYTTLTGSSSSDIRLKRNVENTEVESALNVINQIEMKSFDWLPGWRDYTHQPIGMIADQIEKLDHRLVIGGGYDPDGQPNYKVIDDHYLICYLTKAVQELSAEIKALKGAA